MIDLQAISIHLTDSCPLACSYCYNEKNKYNNNCISFELFKEMIKFYYDYCHVYNNEYKKTGTVVFMGGEPTVYKKEIKKFIEYCSNEYKDFDLNFTFTTNGVLLDEDFIKWCISNNCYIHVSIDGNKQAQDCYRVFKNGTSCFDKVDENLKLLKKINPKKNNLRFTIGPENCKYLIESIEYACSIGYNFFNLIPITQFSAWNEKNRSILKESYYKLKKHWINSVKENKMYNIGWLNKYLKLKNQKINNIKNKNFIQCPAGKTQIGIDMDGNLTPCHRFCHEELSHCIFGNIWDGITDFKKWNYIQDLNYKRYHHESSNCKQCNVYSCKNNCLSEVCSINKDFEKYIFNKEQCDFDCFYSELITNISSEILEELKSLNIDIESILESF